MPSISKRSIVLAVAVVYVIVSIGCTLEPKCNSLIPVAAAIVTAISLFAVSYTPTISLTSEKTKSAREERNRERMLELVKNSWVKGVLEQSLHGEVLIELGLEERGDAVLNRQGIELQTPGKPNRVLQPDTEIVNVFDEMGQTLLILGEPGSGKTTLLLKLARDTIARAEKYPKHRIPVVFNLSSWRDTKPIVDWLVDELITKYYIPKETASDWVKNDELLLLLDGLDEVLPERREACTCAINDFRREHGLTPLAVCCRSEDYEALTTCLDLGGAVSLQPLTEKQVDDYLDQAGQELAALRAALKDDPILYELAQTPLMLSIMTLAYRGMSVHDLQPLETVDARRKHIFDNYVERMFKPRTHRTIPDVSDDKRPDDKRFSKEETIHWLSWLAKRLSQHGQTIFLIERMQPDWLPTRAQQRIVTVGAAIMIGVLFGLFFGLIFVLVFGLFFGASSMLLLPGLLCGSLFGLFYGLLGCSEHIFPVEMPHYISWSEIRTLVSRSMAFGLFIGLFSGLAFGLLVEMAGGPFLGLPFMLLSGLFFMLFFGLEYGGRACIQHIVLRIMLWRNGFAPLNYARFLDYAAGRIFLRKVGGGYIFVHRLLLEYFASLEPEEEVG